MDESEDYDETLEYEKQHVHQVYEQIAGHFSSTRYKAWPVVDEFLKSLPTGSIGLDLGCGNGKYLSVRNDIFIIGSDRSIPLIKIAAQHQPHSTIVADTLDLPHPNSTFDFALSIAVIHHLSLSSRRVQSIRCILNTLKRPIETKKGGRALIFVWALEQKNSRRGWDTGDDQDVLVPWILKSESTETTPITFQRYYHLYRKGELENDVIEAGGNIIQSGYDRDNWWIIIEQK